MSNIFPASIASAPGSIDEKPKHTKRNRGFYILALSQFFTTMGIRAGFAFWAIHITRNLGLPTAQIGVFMAFVAGTEVPFFMLLDPILKRYNPRIMYIVGSIGMGVFYFILGLTPGIIWLIPLIIVRGALWPMYHVPIYLVTSQISRPRNVPTNQALINVTIPSLAVLLTGTATGWLFDHHAAWVFFTACSVLCMIGALIAIIGYRTMQPLQNPE
jgi:predicted MFS family arabinose efflux permease